MALRLLPSLQQLSCRTRPACVPTAAGCRPALQPQPQQQQRCNYSRLESGVFAAGVAVRSALSDPDLLALIWTDRGHAGPVQCSRSRRHRGTVQVYQPTAVAAQGEVSAHTADAAAGAGRSGAGACAAKCKRCGGAALFSRCCRRRQRAHESSCTSKHRCFGTCVCGRHCCLLQAAALADDAPANKWPVSHCRCSNDLPPVGLREQGLISTARAS